MCHMRRRNKQYVDWCVDLVQMNVFMGVDYVCPCGLACAFVCSWGNASVGRRVHMQE